MNATIQETLLNLFHQVIDDPDCIPAVPMDAWPEESQERYLLTGFCTMLERIQQSKRQTEEQLREKEEQYRSIFEASTDALFIQELEDGRVVEVNPAACQIHGYTNDEFLGLTPADFIHPDSFHLVGDTLQTIASGGKYHALGKAVRKDGTTYYADAHVTQFLYKSRLHLLSIVRDVSEQVQTDQKIREREEQYRSVFEAIGDGLFVIDLNGFVVEANPAACRQLGYTYEEMIGLHQSAIIHPDYHFLVPEYLRVIQTGDEFQGRAIDVRKDGTIFPVEVLGRAFTYKGRPHTLSVVRDVTRQVQTEQQLREREAEYRSVFEATSDAILIRDLEDGHVVEANPAACQMYGYSYEEFIGLDANLITHPDSLRLLPEGLQTVRAGQQLQIQGLGLRKDGTPIHIEVRGTPFSYKGKAHLLGVSHDITERVQAQQLLEQRVEERTRELSTLLEVSHNVASTLELKSLLGLVLEQLKVVADYDGATVTIVEGESLVVTDYWGTGRENLLGWRIPLQQLGLIWETISHKEAAIIEDVHADMPMAQSYRQAVGDLQHTIFAPTCAWMAVPMMLKERVIGVLNLSSREPGYFTSRHAALALGIANQAAIAIENARLYAHAQELAAVEERQKLARELHDSVSQALYGISLGAHAARTALERAPGEVAEPLDYVLSLTEAALTEMRALIFELRPESLETEGLVAALIRQTAALQARYEIIVSTELCAEPEIPLHVKQELYRIAQEAMHNTVKHAYASHVLLRLSHSTHELLLEVQDDGSGFDATASFPGHLGLHSMREGESFWCEDKIGLRCAPMPRRAAKERYALHRDPRTFSPQHPVQLPEIRLLL